jgi:fatty-acyl-CoA synthase
MRAWWSTRPRCAELPPGRESGEIVTHGPQVMQGLLEQPRGHAQQPSSRSTASAFLRTGDLAFVDEDGYFFMTDRLKRMINASGFKVWPAEVEALMYQHPAIQEACVIGGPADAPRRDRQGRGRAQARRGAVSEQQIIDWAARPHGRLQVPRIVSSSTLLPKSGTGKVMWRALQEKEAARGLTAPTFW